MKQNTKKISDIDRNSDTPGLGLAAFSGNGKTTLLCEVIPLLRAYGLRLGLVKHSHHAFEMDRPGKDSYRLRHAGASQIVLASNRRSVVLQRYGDSGSTARQAYLNRFLDRVERGHEGINTLRHEHKLDLLLVEGYKYAAIPKIELYRPALGHPLLAIDDPYVIAVASDAPLPQALSVPILDINSPAAVAEFIIANVFPASLT